MKLNKKPHQHKHTIIWLSRSIFVTRKSQLASRKTQARSICRTKFPVLPNRYFRVLNNGFWNEIGRKIQSKIHPFFWSVFDARLRNGSSIIILILDKNRIFGVDNGEGIVNLVFWSLFKVTWLILENESAKVFYLLTWMQRRSSFSCTDDLLSCYNQMSTSFCILAFSLVLIFPLLKLKSREIFQFTLV